MAKQLDPKVAETIAEGILNFAGKPTWKDVVAIAEAITGHAYSRQALTQWTAIKEAYDQRNDENAAPPRKKGERPKSKILRMTEDRLEKLQKKLAHAERVNAQLVEQFIVWSYNARQKGLTQEDLDRPLPVVDRKTNREDK